MGGTQFSFLDSGKSRANLTLISFDVLTCLFFFLFSFCLFGSAQARGLIGAVAAGLHHSSQQHQILDPRSKAPSQIRFRCTMMGTPTFLFYFFLKSL